MRKKSVFVHPVLIFIWLILTCIRSFAQFESINDPEYISKVKQQGKVFDFDLAMAQEDSHKVKSITSALRKYASAKGDEKLLFEADFGDLLYIAKNYSVPQSRILHQLRKLIERTVSTGDLESQIRARVLLAGYYWTPLKEYELAFEEYFILNQLADKLPPKDYSLRSMISYEAGKGYFYFKEYDISKSYFRKVTDVKSKDIDVVPPAYQPSLNYLGLAWQKTGNLDSSDHYLRQLETYSRGINDSIWISIAIGYLGNNQFLKGNFAKAETYLAEGIDIALMAADTGWAIRQKLWLADVYFNQNKFTEAGSLITWTKANLQKNESQDNNDLLILLYPLTSKMYSATGDVKAAGIYLDSTIHLSSLINNEFSGLLLARVQQKINLSEQKSILDEKNDKIRERNILIGFVLILLFGSIYVYRLQQKKYKQQQQLKEAQLHQKQTEIESSKGRLDDFRKMIADKNALIELLETQTAYGANDEVFSELQKSNILTNHDWEKFKNLFEKVHGGFLENLQIKLPGLSPTETRYMALAKLNFSNKEMAYALGVSPESIRVTLHRLRKKLDLSEEISMDEFINSI